MPHSTPVNFPNAGFLHHERPETSKIFPLGTDVSSSKLYPEGLETSITLEYSCTVWQRVILGPQQMLLCARVAQSV
jgi:hypothetical protein